MEAWLDGEFVDWQEVKVSPLSHAFSRGVAIFEVALVCSTERGPSVFLHQDHLERFYNSARLMHMDLAQSPQELGRAILETARRNRVSDGLLKYYAYFTGQEMSPLPKADHPSVVIYGGSNEQMGFDPVKASAPKAAGLAPYRKLHCESVPIKAKVTGYYVGAYLASLELTQQGIDVPIFLDAEGFVTEGGVQNHFFVRGGEIITPPLKRVLAGTTRRVVIEACREQGLTVREEDLRAEDLAEMEEGFCCGSISRISPFKSLEGRELSPCPGPVTRRVLEIMDQVYRCARPEYTRYHTLV